MNFYEILCLGFFLFLPKLATPVYGENHIKIGYEDQHLNFSPLFVLLIGAGCVFCEF